MNVPVSHVEWLMSAYDATWHAFPMDQTNDQTRAFYQALCDRSVPVRHVERTLPRMFCPACLVLYGTHISDDQRWRMGGDSLIATPMPPNEPSTNEGTA